MNRVRSLARRLRLRHLLFLLLLLSGIIPLAISSFLLIRQYTEILETEERAYLTRSAEILSVELNDYLVNTRKQLLQLGSALLATPEPSDLEDRLRQPWVARYLQDFMAANPNLVALRVLNPAGMGPRFTPSDLTESAVIEMDTAFEQVRSRGIPIYRFTVLPILNEPVTVMAVPIFYGGSEPRLFVEALARLDPMEAVFRREAQREVAVFLIDRGGKVLWSEGADQGVARQVEISDLVRDFRTKPLNLTQQYSVAVEGKSQKMLGRVSPVDETGWGVVVQKPLAVALTLVRRMVVNAVVSTLLLLLVALIIAIVFANRLSQPIQRLAKTSHDIAAGNFGQRVEPTGLGVEIRELAADFNRMSGYVQQYVEQLRDAAQANRELFIGSIRAFAAAIDAKDPYTRGHSERVAAYSRTIARHLGQGEEFQHRIWVAALLHDVGKIGIEDRILKKGGVLTAEEYEEMKLHPVIGADILSPIEQLKEMIPAIRWHHENWDGRGYPEGLRSEQIPLIARIVAVADCFDAITTNRPYQRAYQPAFAVETITKIAGTRFDAKVVTAFLRAFECGDIRMEREAAEAEVEAVSAGAAASG